MASWCPKIYLQMLGRKHDNFERQLDIVHISERYRWLNLISKLKISMQNTMFEFRTEVKLKISNSEGQPFLNIWNQPINSTYLLFRGVKTKGSHYERYFRNGDFRCNLTFFCTVNTLTNRENCAERRNIMYMKEKLSFILNASVRKHVVRNVPLNYCDHESSKSEIIEITNHWSHNSLKSRLVVIRYHWSQQSLKSRIIKIMNRWDHESLRSRIVEIANRLNQHWAA